MEQNIHIRFAGISIRIASPIRMEVPQALKPFLTAPTRPDETFQIQLLHQPLTFPQPPVYSSFLLEVYQESDGWTRVHPGMQGKDGCQVACRLRSSGNHTLYFPASEDLSHRYSSTLATLLAPEHLLQRHDGFLLHSSVVGLDGKAVLFCGPSGIGKSTQAELWRTHLGAEILNGDRCAVIRRGQTYFGCGSPYCGSSGIYRTEEAPIAAIVLLGQSPDNSIRKATTREITRAFYRETIVNTWDEAYTRHLLSMLDGLVQAVPVYMLSCRADSDAVQLAYQTIFE